MDLNISSYILYYIICVCVCVKLHVLNDLLILTDTVQTNTWSLRVQIPTFDTEIKYLISLPSGVQVLTQTEHILSVNRFCSSNYTRKAFKMNLGAKKQINKSSN